MCRDCNLHFTVQPDRFRQHTKILLDHLDGISYRALTSRYHYNKDKLCSVVNSLTGFLKRCIEITRELKPANYTGNFIVDGKYVPTKDCVPDRSSGKVPRPKKRAKIEKGLVLITGCDYQTHDIPHIATALSESFYDFSRYFENLKSIDYPLKSLTCDDKELIIIQACLRSYPKAKIQLCLRHYSAEIKRKLKVQGIKRTIKSLEKKLAYLDDDLRIPYTSRKYSFKRAVELANQIAQLEYHYQSLIDFQDLMLGIIFTKSLKERDEYLDELENIFFKYYFKEKLIYKEHRRRILAVYRSFEKDARYLFTHLNYPELNVPTTTNLVEAMNGHLEDRLTSIRGFESRKTAENYLNALILQRRFKIFTSCREPFKHLNGKSPLEIAKAKNISKIRNWIRFCKRKF